MYKIVKKIGKGSYGNVYIVSKKEKRYAMKKINIINQDFKEKINLINEIRILKYSCCPYILNFLDVKYNGYNVEIITDLIKYGDLHSIIKKQNGIRFNEEKIWSYFIQTCFGVEYLHNNNIIHRDLKSANIFLDENDKIVIGDFGISKVLYENDFTNTNIGTPYYMSPEIFNKKLYSKDVDIWALGCFLYELITFEPPFTAKSLYNLIKKIKTMKYGNKIELLKNVYSKELLNLLPLFFCSVSNRITISEIVKHRSITEKLNLIPQINTYSKCISNFREKFRNNYSQPWNMIIKNLEYNENIVDISKSSYKLPSLFSRNIELSSKISNNIKKKHNLLKEPWLIPTKKNDYFGKPPPLPKISRQCNNRNLRYRYGDKYKKIYNNRSPFLYN